MANLSYFIPTKKIDLFNKESIYILLLHEFENFVIDNSNSNSIQIKDDKDNIICDLYFNENCYLVNYEEDIKNLSENKELKLIDDLIKLRELKPNLKNSISMSGCRVNRREVEIFLHKFFKAYIFDEGIHPEFIPPDYIWYVDRNDFKSQTILKKCTIIFKKFFKP